MTDSDERLRALIVAELDAELSDRLDERSAMTTGAQRRHAPERGRLQRWLPAAAAAAVLVVVALTVVVIRARTSPDSGAPAAASGGVRVTCTPTSPADVNRDRRQLEQRAAALGRAATVSVAGSRITVSIAGAVRAGVGGLCASNTLQLRPLVAPPVAIDPATSAATDSPLPASEQEYDRLPPAEQRAVTELLRGASCMPRAVVATQPVIVCTKDTDPATAALVGPALVTQDGIASARAVAPSASAGSLSWTVTVTLTSRAAAGWASYTRAHNSGSTPAGNAAQCAATSMSCADYVAFVVNGQIVSLPLTIAPITGGVVQVSGSFDQATAQQLASAVAGGSLPVPLRVATVTTY